MRNKNESNLKTEQVKSKAPNKNLNKTIPKKVQNNNNSNINNPYNTKNIFLNDDKDQSFTKPLNYSFSKINKGKYDTLSNEKTKETKPRFRVNKESREKFNSISSGFKIDKNNRHHEFDDYNECDNNKGFKNNDNECNKKVDNNDETYTSDSNDNIRNNTKEDLKNKEMTKILSNEYNNKFEKEDKFYNEESDDDERDEDSIELLYSRRTQKLNQIFDKHVSLLQSSRF